MYHIDDRQEKRVLIWQRARWASLRPSYGYSQKARGPGWTQGPLYGEDGCRVSALTVSQQR